MPPNAAWRYMLQNIFAPMPRAARHARIPAGFGEPATSGSSAASAPGAAYSPKREESR